MTTTSHTGALRVAAIGCVLAVLAGACSAAATSTQRPPDTIRPTATPETIQVPGDSTPPVTAAPQPGASATLSTSASPSPTPQSLSGAAGHALRFFGTGSGDVDRVKIRVDDPGNDLPGSPADVGATDFTIEWWMRADAVENPAPAVECGPGNVNWIYGNIVFDRDRYNQDRKFGISLAGGRLVFGVSGDGTGDATLCNRRNLADGEWHHVAVQRRRSDGRMWIFVDGLLESETDGPDGDISYPDGGQPLDFCGGPCVNSDPFLVIGAEKHDAGPAYPSFSGWIDEVRLSTALRYSGDFARPGAPFEPDADTAALYHFDEGSGGVASDSASGASPGEVKIGGPQQGPQWVISDAPLND